jgi:hypothetical protein
LLSGTLSGQLKSMQGPELASLLAPADQANPPWEIIR